MPENFSLRQPAAPLEWTHSATIPPKTGKTEQAISPPKDDASSSQPVDVDVRRRIARSHRYRFMQGMMANEGAQRAGRAEIVSRPVQTPEQVNQMVEELARMRNVGKEQLYQEILSPETYQYASLFDPDFKVHLFPIGNKQGLLLACHDENGQVKEVRSGVTLDYVLTQLPDLRQSCSVAQDDGVRIQMVEDGLPSRCDRNGKAIYINQADVPPCVNTEQDKALYLVSVLGRVLN